MISERQLRANRENAKKAGRKPGSKKASTLSKELAREALRQQVSQAQHAMTAVQIAHAQGIGHLFRRDKQGRYARIEDQDQIDAILARGLGADEQGGTYYIFAKDPSVQAFTDLMNRALDKPKEQPLDVTVNATLTLEARKARLNAGRAHAAKALGKEGDDRSEGNNS